MLRGHDYEIGPECESSPVPDRRVGNQRVDILDDPRRPMSVVSYAESLRDHGHRLRVRRF